jgi:hypothetical protein
MVSCVLNFANKPIYCISYCHDQVVCLFGLPPPSPLPMVMNGNQLGTKKGITNFGNGSLWESVFAAEKLPMSPGSFCKQR